MQLFQTFSKSKVDRHCTYGPESAKTRLRVKFHKMTFPIFSFYWAWEVRKQNITRVGRLIVVLKVSQTHQGIVLKNPKKNKTKLLSQERNEERSTRLKEETWMIFVKVT